MAAVGVVKNEPANSEPDHVGDDPVPDRVGIVGLDGGVRVTERRSYGICPAQLDGFTAEGRPFYFRSRHEQWTLELGQVGWVANICGWPHRGDLVAHGDVEMTDPDEIDAILSEALGPWRPATWEERLFDRLCRCGNTFRSDGSTICSDCLRKALRGDDDSSQ